MRRFRDIDRFPPAERPAGVQPHSLQQKGGMLAGSVIIIHNQHPERRQTVMFFRCALAQAEGQFHSKCCPFASLLLTEMTPPIRETRLDVMGMPSPVPPYLAAVDADACSKG